MTHQLVYKRRYKVTRSKGQHHYWCSGFIRVGPHGWSVFHVFVISRLLCKRLLRDSRSVPVSHWNIGIPPVRYRCSCVGNARRERIVSDRLRAEVEVPLQPISAILASQHLVRARGPSPRAAKEHRLFARLECLNQTYI